MPLTIGTESRGTKDAENQDAEGIKDEWDMERCFSVSHQTRSLRKLSQRRLGKAPATKAFW